jgi:hypothetical protein
VRDWQRNTTLCFALQTAINQDSLGVQGVPVASQSTSADNATCWYKPLSDGSVAAIVLNTGDDSDTITCELSELLAGAGGGGGEKKEVVSIRDLWAKKAVAVPAGGAKTGQLSAKLESHDHQFLLIKTK